MPKATPRDIAYCLEKAKGARRSAEGHANARDKDFYLELEMRWLMLANQLDIQKKIGQMATETARWPKPRH